MKRLILFIAIMALVLPASCAKRGEQKSGVQVAKVGSEVITKDDVEKELKALPSQIQNMFQGPEGAGKFVDELVKREMLYQEAKKKGLDNTPEYKKKVDDFKKITLIGSLLEKEVEEKSKVTDNDIKTYYDAHKSELTMNNQIKASHILVKTEDEAKKISDQLKKGGDFAKLAKEKSIDPGSAKNGGDLGFFSKGQMVPEFEKIAFNLKVGQISEPVKTQFGYHIIKVTGRKEGQIVEFDKVKNLLTQRVTAEKQKEVFDSYMNSLKGSYKVDINKDAVSQLAEANKGKAGQESPKPEQKPESKPEGKK